MAIRFTWDPKKAKRNLHDHGIEFEAAKHVFNDPHVVVIEDVDTEEELRYNAIGYAAANLFVVVTYLDLSEEEEEVIRLISARKGDAFEESVYADQFA